MIRRRGGRVEELGEVDELVGRRMRMAHDGVGWKDSLGG